MSTGTTLLPATITLSVTGRCALEAVRANLAGNGALTLAKYADPVSEAAYEMTTEAAEAVISQDSSLIYLQAEVEFWAMAGDEVIAQCGIMQVSRRLPAGSWTVGIADIPQGAERITVALVDDEDAEAVSRALSVWIREAVEG